MKKKRMWKGTRVVAFMYLMSREPVGTVIRQYSTSEYRVEQGALQCIGM